MMKDRQKTKERLIKELVALRQRIAELESSEIEREQSKEFIQHAHEYAENIVATLRESLVMLDADLRVISANRSI